MRDLEALYAELRQIELQAKETYKAVQNISKSTGTGTAGSTNIGAIEAQMQQVLKLVESYKLLQKEIKAAEDLKAKAGGSHRENVYNRAGGGASSEPASDTPPKGKTPAGFNMESVDQRFRKALENMISALNMSASGITSQSKFQVGESGKRALFTGQYSTGQGDLTEFKYFLDEFGNFGRNLKELNTKAFVNSEVGSRIAEEARRRGYDPYMDLKKVRSYEGGVYSTAEYSRYEGGIQKMDTIRFDKQGNMSSMIPPQKQYRSFAQDIQRDLSDLLKWSVAISAIYGPINAITEAIGLMIENETQLADVSVALNDEVANTGMVFESVYGSSQRAGESIQGVIEAFGQAYRAAGRVSNEYQRYNTSVQLLNDSLTLSKLSTLDQIQAIDVLTAALYQTAPAGESAAESLARGQDLLDKWVRVSKIASVDVETLATGVAVLGDSAETAGLSVDQLNALVATLAETSLVSGKEAANVAKALIGNYQSDSAVRELGRLGIAVTDVSGKTRDFMTVMTEVAAMRESGLIGNEDFNRLTLALGGGGIRRQKDVAAFIENFGRMQQITAAQQGSGGESAEALSRKLDTVNTSSAKLSNSFQNLVQSMGDEGGLLDAFSAFLNVGTASVDVLDQLISRTGKVGPLLVGLAAAFAVFRNKDIAAGLVNNLNMSVGMAEWVTGRRNILGGVPLSGSPIRSAIGRATTLPSVAAIALPAAQNFASGDTEEGVANIAGGIAGALIGGPVGALVGAGIAEAFVRSTLTYETEFANFFAGAVEKGSDTQGAGVSFARSPDELERMAFESIGGGDQYIGKLLAQVENFMTSDLVNTYTPFGQVFGQGIREAGGTTGQYNTTEAAALNILKRTNPELYEEMMAVYAAQGGQIPGTTTSLTRRENLLAGQNASTLRGMQFGRQDELTKLLIEGEIKPSDYAKRTASLSAFSVSATRSTAALVDESGALSDEFGSLEENYRDFLDIFSSGNEELINQINSQVAAVAYLQNLWDNWSPTKKEMEFTNPYTNETMTGTREDVARMLEESRSILSNTRDYGSEQVRIQNMRLPEMYGSYTTPSFANTNELNMVLQEALKRQEMFYTSEEGGGLSAEDYEALKNSFEDITTAVGEAGDYFYKKVTDGVDRKFLDEVYKQYQDEGKISGGSTKNLGFTEIDVTKPQLEGAVTQANALAYKLQEEYGYVPQLEDTLIATNDEQISKQHVDMKMLQYILQQILDTEKKQLQGIYNLPEGATAWVPYQSIPLWDGEGEGIGGGVTLKDPKLTADTPYSQVPGEELSMYGFKSLQDLIDGLTSKSDFDTLSSKDSANKFGRDNLRDEIFGKSKGGSEESVGMLEGILSRFVEAINGLKSQVGGEWTKGKFDTLTSSSPLKQSSESQPVSTKLDLKFSSTTQLIVDGRVLATIIKPYIAADLMRANESGGTITRSYVI